MSAAIQPIAGFAGIAPIMHIRPIRLPRRVPAIEVGAYSVMEYKRCGQPELHLTRMIAEGFAEEMQDRGHKYAFRCQEDRVSPKQWHTPTDQDRFGIDTVDMAYLATHGGTYMIPVQTGQGNTSKPLYWYLASCDSPDGCFITSLRLDPQTRAPPDPKKPVTNLRLGDGKLRWLVLDTCRSLQIGTVNEFDKTVQVDLAKVSPSVTWARCYAGIHLLFGFTGLVTDDQSLQKRGKAFGRRVGRGDILAESWLDESYSSSLDNVPVVTAFAQSLADLDKLLKSESLRKPAPTPKQPVIRYFIQSMWRS